MAGNRVVAHYRDGRLVKGTTSDFLPTRDYFHVAPDGGGAPVAVPIGELKALFFVKDLVGDPQHQARNEFHPAQPAGGWGGGYGGRTWAQASPNWRVRRSRCRPQSTR